MPKIIIADRICPHCGGIEWWKQDDVLICWKQRETQRKKLWANNNKDRVNDSHRKSYQRNRENRLSTKREKDKLPHVAQRRRERENLSTIELHDSRVKKMLIHHLAVDSVKTCDITPEMIELKRKQLKIYRHVKETISNAANC